MMFPGDLLRFIYWIYFRPISFHTLIDQMGPTIRSVFTLFAIIRDNSTRSFQYLVLFHILITPWLLGLGTGTLLMFYGMDMNWLKWVFYLFIAMALSLTFRVDFCIAFLLPFSILVAIWSSTSFTQPLAILLSLILGLVYGLGSTSAAWGLIAGLVYGVISSLFLGSPGGLAIGAAFFIGYFRIVFYLLEAPISWSLGTLARGNNALRLWKYNPVTWDEWIWLPLPGLDRHLQALLRQDVLAAQEALHTVETSFRQGWAAERVLKQGRESGELK